MCSDGVVAIVRVLGMNGFCLKLRLQCSLLKRSIDLVHVSASSF
jgi:hypothetical protein